MSEQISQLFEMILTLDRKFTTFAQQAGYEFDLEGNATRVAKPAGVPLVKTKRDPVKMGDYDLSGWPELPDEQLFDDWRRAKKGAKASVSQTAINTIGKQLCLSAKDGFSVNDCLSTAESSSWKGFQASWMKKPDTKIKRHSFQELATGKHLESLQHKQEVSPLGYMKEFAALEHQHSEGE